MKKKRGPTRAKTPRTPADVLRAIENGMMVKAMYHVRESDKVREVAILPVRGPDDYERRAAREKSPGLPLSPVEKLIRKHAMRKAVRAKMREEMSK